MSQPIQETPKELLASPIEADELDFPRNLPIQDIFETLAAVIKFKNPLLYKHCERVGIISYLLALQMGYSTRGADILQYMGWIHDIGSIYLPHNLHAHFLTEEILSLPKWNEIYKLHPVIGSNILSNLRPLNGDKIKIANIILYHHENWDGSGFPKGLKGKEIPQEARILRVVDSFIRMVDPPPLGKGMGFKDALFEILRFSKVYYDPQVVSRLINIEDTIKTWLELLNNEH